MMAFSVLAFIATAVSVVSAQATFTRAGVAASSPDYGESVLVVAAIPGTTTLAAYD